MPEEREPPTKDPTMEVETEELASLSGEMELPGEPTRTAPPPVAPPATPSAGSGPIATEKTRFGPPPKAPDAKQFDAKKSTMSALLDELADEMEGEMLEEVDEDASPPPPPKAPARP